MKTINNLLCFALTGCLITACNAQNQESGESNVKQNVELSNQETEQKGNTTFESFYLGEEPPDLTPKVFAPDIISSKDNYDKGSYSNPIELDTPIKSTECYFALDNSYVIFASASPGYRKLDLCVRFLKNDGIWSKPINLGKNINSSESESAPVISPDGKYLFYNSDGEFYWVSAKIIEALGSKY